MKEQTFKIGDKVQNISHIGTPNAIGTITAIAPDGALFGKWDNEQGSFWRFQPSMVRKVERDNATS